MVTESPMTMMPRAMMGGGGEDLEKELGLLLRRQDASDRERELNIYRSGSAPPTVEGSLFSRPGLTDEELRSDPRYLSYYYSNVNLNPRLPPPVLSKEDWRSTQRFQSGFGGIGDKRNRNNDHRPPPSEEQGGGGSSLFSLQPRFQPEDPNAAGEWLDKGGDGLIGLPGLPLGRQNSFADIFQDDVGRKTPLPNHPSRPASRSAFSSGSETLGSEDKLALHHVGSSDSMQPIGQNVVGAKNSSVSASQTFASVLGKSLSRSTTPDPQLVAKAPSPRLPPVGARLNNTDKKHNNGSCSLNSVKAGMAQSNDLVASLSSMNLSTSGGADDDIMAQSKLQQEIMNHQKFLFGSQGAQDHTNQSSLRNSDLGYLSMSSIPQLPKSSYPELARKNGGLLDRNNSVPPANSYLRRPSSPSVVSPGGSSVHLNMDTANATFTGYGLSGYSVSPALSPTMASQIGSGNLPPLYENAAAAAAVSAIGSPGMGSKSLGSIPLVPNLSGVADFQNLTRIGNPSATSTLQMPFFDPVYVQYLRAMEYAAQVAANYGDPSMDMGYMTNSYTELLGMQKAYLGTLLQPQKSHDMPFLGKSGSLNSGYFGSPAFGGMSYPGSPLANPILPGSPVGHGSPLRHGDRSIHFPSSLRNFSGGVMGSWQSDSGNLGENYPSSLLDEFKSNKTKCYELSEIAGHVVEFSADQYGSRFIQQKLETATTEDKDMVFEEIMPQAFSLMTDVFGNYVIQKFFEHGSAAQRRELADQLSGHVLTLSLQMYGCRVIQKAIEVVDLDQQTKMVAELDGHIMRCVRDQNGNHVIQKCIECVPQDAIHFIISSFYEQVVTLSTHPYGCRVIQRVLEHCDDPKTQQIMMDEIMGSVSMLAQDQYGNYVVQHVLEHGKPYERSAIITKLTGQIVQMSQQKFASNVVEKCLTHGDQEERRILISEMLGSTEENEPLQAMMKDQFANYVVQKVLETCDEAQREHILSRIKVHLNALKKYTYGKHIVARVEKLVAAGERRMGVQSSYTS